MSDLYLSHVEIENFRTFGKFALDLPAGPGLTLLVGTNGLGKSSFFDGLEWCLTGEIRRFADHVGGLKEKDYLTRRDAKANTHIVTLRFGLDDTVQRSSRSKPDPTKVIELLKTDRWGQIDDLDTYLSFTHFLGQAAQQRFTSRKASEQWQSLKGPSGIDRLEEVRAALRGAATTNAFTRRLAQQEVEVVRLDVAIGDWEDFTTRLSRLRLEAEAAGQLSGPSLDARVAELARRLSLLTGEQTNDTAVTPQNLVNLRQKIDGQLAVVGRRRAELGLVEPVVEQYAVARAASNADSAGATITKATEAVNRAADEYAKAVQERQQTQELIQQLEATISRLDSEASNYVAASGLLARISEATAEYAAADTAAKELEQRAKNARKELEAVQEIVRANAALVAHHEGLQQNANSAHTRFTEAASIATLAADFDLKKGLAEEAGARATESAAKGQVFQDEKARLASEIQNGEVTLARARKRSSELAAAVASIAAHLDIHDINCPICSTVFGEGELKRLADAAAAAHDATLAGLEEEQRRRASRADEVERQLLEVNRVIQVAAKAQSDSEAAATRYSAARRVLAQRLNASETDDLSALAQLRSNEAQAAASAANAQISANAENVATATTSIGSLTATLSALDSQLTTERRKSSALQAELTMHHNTRTASPYYAATLETLNALSQENIQARATAVSRRAELAEALAVRAAQEADWQQRLDVARAELARIDHDITGALQLAARLQTRWAEADLPAEPSQATLAAALDDVSKQETELKLLLSDQTHAVAAAEAASKQVELANLVARMDGIGGLGAANDPGTRLTNLKKLREEAQAAYELTAATQVAVNAYTAKLKVEAEAFSTQFLLPLNDLINDYNQALLSTPGESIRLNASHNVNRTQFDMGMRYGDQLDEALYNVKLPPQIVLSEGQMAANGFSILCAASTAYPWSRWRALLLDDPLQHNDIIHAAAFADVMRNMVELCGYQLIMSSHDRAEGEYFARKFDAAGLPCTVVALTAPSKDGVRFDPPVYNAAARTMMQTPDSSARDNVFA